MRGNPAVLSVLLLLSNAICAEGTGMRIGANLWYGNIDGSLRYPGDDPSNDIDLRRDLGYDSTAAGNYYLRLEHPLPLLPNALISSTSIRDSASGRVSHTFDFGGSSFTVGDDVESELQFRQGDVILYYSIFDTVASIDVGVDARYIDSSTILDGSSGGMESASLSGWVPLLYAGVGLDLPLTGLSIGADGSFTGYRGSRLYDVTLHASYTTPWRAGADLGYRYMNLGLDDFDNFTADAEFSGPYAGVFVNF